MRRLTTGIRSEKCVVRRFRRCANVYLHVHSTAYYTRRLCGIDYCSLSYKPVQHVTVLNTVGICNTAINIIILQSCGTTVVNAIRRWAKSCYLAHTCSQNDPLSADWKNIHRRLYRNIISEFVLGKWKRWKLNTDRPAWCHSLYYFTIYCSTCFEC